MNGLALAEEVRVLAARRLLRRQELECRARRGGLEQHVDVDARASGRWWDAYVQFCAQDRMRAVQRELRRLAIDPGALYVQIALQKAGTAFERLKNPGQRNSCSATPSAPYRVQGHRLGFPENLNGRTDQADDGLRLE